MLDVIYIPTASGPYGLQYYAEQNTLISNQLVHYMCELEEKL